MVVLVVEVEAVVEVVGVVKVVVRVAEWVVEKVEDLEVAMEVEKAAGWVEVVVALAVVWVEALVVGMEGVEEMVEV